jgi:U3 small nucleolar RNA-associated protein 13
MHVNTAGETFRTFKAHQMPVLCMAYDPTGTLVATGSADRTIRVWDMAGGFCTHSFRDHTDIVRTVTFHPDPQRLLLISTSDDNTVRVFDLRDSKCVAVFRTHVSLPTAVAFSPDGYLMASCGRDKVKIMSVVVHCRRIAAHCTAVVCLYRGRTRGKNAFMIFGVSYT